jgi:hypothetical protein
MTEMKATIDRIEGSLAVLISHESNPVTFNIPISFLGDCHEGDIIDIAITRDPESTKAAKVRVSSLIEKLKQKSNNR